jgi:hypothetical protein
VSAKIGVLRDEIHGTTQFMKSHGVNGTPVYQGCWDPRKGGIGGT